MQIETGLYRRQGKALTNFAATLPATQSGLAQQLLKDPYNFDFASEGTFLLCFDTSRSANSDSCCFEVSFRRFPANACFLPDAPQRPAQPLQRDDLLSILFAQYIAHVEGG
jgi:hypothetical protein